MLIACACFQIVLKSRKTMRRNPRKQSRFQSMILKLRLLRGVNCALDRDSGFR